MTTGRGDGLDDFDARLTDVQGTRKTVYVTGSGPAVVLMPEMPGISPDVVRLARWIRGAGLTGARVAVAAYGGVDRGAAITPGVFAALDEADVEVIPSAMALNSSLARLGRFSEFDVISAGILLGRLQPCPAPGDPDGRP